VGLGALAAARPGFRNGALEKLRALARDPRWRLREGVAQGLQRLLAADAAEIISVLEGWIRPPDWTVMRAAAAAVAEPSLLQNARIAVRALELHSRIIREIRGARDRRAEEFRILRKGLGYTLSVVACGAPTAGLNLLAELAGEEDRDLRWIFKENLKKNRLRILLAESRTLPPALRDMLPGG